MVCIRIYYAFSQSPPRRSLNLPGVRSAARGKSGEKRCQDNWKGIPQEGINIQDSCCKKMKVEAHNSTFL